MANKATGGKAYMNETVAARQTRAKLMIIQCDDACVQNARTQVKIRNEIARLAASEGLARENQVDVFAPTIAWHGAHWVLADMHQPEEPVMTLSGERPYRDALEVAHLRMSVHRRRQDNNLEALVLVAETGCSRQHPCERTADATQRFLIEAIRNLKGTFPQFSVLGLLVHMHDGEIDAFEWLDTKVSEQPRSDAESFEDEKTDPARMRAATLR